MKKKRIIPWSSALSTIAALGLIISCTKEAPQPTALSSGTEGSPKVLPTNFIDWTSGSNLTFRLHSNSGCSLGRLAGSNAGRIAFCGSPTATTFQVEGDAVSGTCTTTGVGCNGFTLNRTATTCNNGSIYWIIPNTGPSTKKSIWIRALTNVTLNAHNGDAYFHYDPVAGTWTAHSDAYLTFCYGLNLDSPAKGPLCPC